LIGFGVELRRDRVHDLAPGPEGPAVTVCAAAQDAVEGVRVRGHATGQGEAGNRLGAGGCGAGAGHDPAGRTRVIARARAAIRDGPVDPGFFAPELSAHRAPPPAAAGPVAAPPSGPVAAPPSGLDAAPPAGPGAAPSEPPGTSISSSRARTLM